MKTGMEYIFLFSGPDSLTSMKNCAFSHLTEKEIFLCAWILLSERFFSANAMCFS